MNEKSYKELVLLFRNEDSKHFAYNLIVKKYQEKLYSHIRKILISHDDTDDVFQNTLLKVFTGLESFREEAGLYTWLYRIATNESITFLNQKRRKYMLPIVDVEKHLSNTLESDPFFNGDELQLKLQTAILKLPEKQRIVFNMKYFDDIKYEEMSEILKTSVGALKASYHHAIKKIEKYLDTV